MSNSATLLAGGAHASNLCLSLLSTNPAFLALSQSEGTGIADRDAEDGHMLSAGIMSSLANNVLSPADKTTVPYTPITVDGKTPAEVSDIIMSSLAPPTAGGRVITVVGLSGVGKGTTVATLKASLAATRADKNAENVMCWSNGNIFRSLTMLTSLYMQEKGLSDLNEAIAGGGSKELKKTLLGCLTFEVNPATKEFDTHIVGFGVDYWVKDIEITELKGPLVSGKIPSIAKHTQGEVVKFVSSAITELTTAAGIDVIVEGRSETVDYIASPARFSLVMDDASVIGARRAAQRVAGEFGKRGGGEEGDVQKVLEEIVKDLK